MRRCELCRSVARMYCESDQASLCWDCDAKVHSANFLVARHSRTLLCHVCQSPTAWSASGSNLGPTVSVCRSCVEHDTKGVEENREEERRGSNAGEVDTEDGDYDDDDEFDDEGDEEDGDRDDDDEEEEEELSEDDEDGDNQVVPWSSTPPPPPPAASSSSSEESSSRFCNGDGAVSLKRFRDKATDLRSDDDQGCSSSHRNSSPSATWSAGYSETAFLDSLRPLKRLTTDPVRAAMVHSGPAGSRTASLLDSLKKFRGQNLTSGNDASSTIVEICELSKNSAAVDLDSAGMP
uniref:Orphans2 n=1 Tax=Diospyros kaki TaxID=35925 RepID=A0A5P9PAR0_DIOKA|nr:Orphans2 [Diospyros kaki]